MKLDISDFSAESVPETQSRRDAQEFSKSPVRLFVEEQIEQFRHGYSCDAAYQAFREYSQRNGFAQMNIKSFGLKIKEFTTKERTMRDGIRKNRYTVLAAYDLPREDDEVEAV
jgi:hypothetical protein